jgi:catechol 2,3-dioxygenase
MSRCRQLRARRGTFGVAVTTRMRSAPDERATETAVDFTVVVPTTKESVLTAASRKVYHHTNAETRDRECSTRGTPAFAWPCSGQFSRNGTAARGCAILPSSGGKGIARWRTGGNVTKVLGIRHAVLGVRNTPRSITFYTEALGMELVTFLEDMQMAFLSFGERDHDLALIKVPEDQPVGSSGLAHIAFEIDGGPQQLRELHARLKARGVETEMTADHVITQSLYFLDPDGNRFELFTQVMPETEAKQYLHDARAMADVMRPLDFEAVAG